MNFQQKKIEKKIVPVTGGLNCMISIRRTTHLIGRREMFSKILAHESIAICEHLSKKKLPSLLQMKRKTTAVRTIEMGINVNVVCKMDNLKCTISMLITCTQ